MGFVELFSLSTWIGNFQEQLKQRKQRTAAKISTKRRTTISVNWQKSLGLC